MGGEHKTRSPRRLIVTAAGLAVVAAALGIVVRQPDDEATPGLAPDHGSQPAWKASTRYYVSPSGSDRWAGTRRRPWRRLSTALRRSRPGVAILLAPGTYGAPGTTAGVTRSGTTARPIVVRSAGHPRAHIEGRIRVTASHVRLERLVLDGPTGQVRQPSGENPGGEEVPLSIYGDDVTVSSTEVRNSRWHAGIYLEGVRGARIVGNYIHDNGDRANPENANLDHGVYWASGSGLLANNVITDNVARGVQLYPAADGVLVVHNTILGNGRAGVQVGAHSSNNVILDNIVAFNGDHGIRSAELTGTGNRAVNNLVWSNAGGGPDQQVQGLQAQDTIVADPRLGRGWCPSAGSAAVDAAARSAVRTDRTGRPRNMGARADIGACERKP